MWWEMKTEKCFGLTKGRFQGDWGQRWDSGVPTAHSLPDHWVTWHLFMFVYRFRKSEHLHLSWILDREKIADNGNKNTSKRLERPSSNRALSTALQSVQIRAERQTTLDFSLRM